VVLADASSGAFGARNIPKSLRAITMLGIEQARVWNCGTLNEFRKFFGLKQYETFEEINPDPYVAEQLKHLYGGYRLLEMNLCHAH
jgi:linoleate 10R-lipoxygenase